ncbi:MAG: helix-turn-helix domain-containing protein [Bradyrhizobium sp.]
MLALGPHEHARDFGGPWLSRHLEITGKEIGALSGISRRNTNRCLKQLRKQGSGSNRA